MEDSDTVKDYKIPMPNVEFELEAKETKQRDMNKESTVALHVHASKMAACCDHSKADQYAGQASSTARSVLIEVWHNNLPGTPSFSKNLL